MTLHPQAETLSLLLIAETAQRQQPEGWEYAAYRVLDRYFSDWPEAKTADLYAKIAEQYNPTMTLGSQQALLSRLLWSNENWWADR